MENTNQARASTVAGLAIRFSYYGDVFWLVSTHLPGKCTLASSTHTCAKANAIKTWRKGLPTTQDRIAIGGALAAPDLNNPTMKTASSSQQTPSSPKDPSGETTGWFSGWFSSQATKGKANTPTSSTKQPGDETTAPKPILDCSRFALVDPTEETHMAEAKGKLGCLASYRLTFENKPPKRSIHTPTPLVEKPE
ncbi:MAG: hypothetical protein AAFV69_12235 [Pseudomonadota bacterium]